MEELTKEQLELQQLADECMEESLELILVGKIKEAEKTTTRAKDIYEQLPDKSRLASALNRLSVIYDDLGDENVNLQYLLDAVDCALDSDDYCIKAKLYNNLGCEFLYSYAYDKALEFFRLAFDNYSVACSTNPVVESENHAFAMLLNLNFCTIYSQLGEIEHARKHFMMAKLDYALNTDEDLVLVYKISEGLFLWRAGEQEKAREMVLSILESAKEIEYTADYLEVLSDLLRLLREMKDFDRWKETLELMDSKLSVGDSLYLKSEMLKRWIEFYQDSGDDEKYKETCVKYVETLQDKAEEDYVRRAEHVSLQIAMRRAAKQKAISDTKVYLDPLTGIGNRNRMLDDSENYIAESIKNDTSITIGLIDIDFFKECNDTYGHISGDNCLKKVAAIIQEAVGERGNVYRYGGDEFLVLFDDLKEEEIPKLGEKIKKNIDLEAIPNEKSSIKPFITVSQGYTQAIAEEGDTIETLVNLADQVLYDVKRSGRNGYKYGDISEFNV